MNKKAKIKNIVIFVLTILIIANIASVLATYSNTNSNEVNIGDEIDFTIDFEEKVITADFQVSFDSSKLTYIGSSTDNLKTNYVQEQSKIFSCYYDINKIGTEKIILKFKANQETNKTNIKISNIIAHTAIEEKQIPDIISENIKIKKANQEISKNTTMNEGVNNAISNNIENNNENSNTDSNVLANTINTTNKSNEITDNTKSIKPLPKTGIGLSSIDMIIIIITVIVFVLIIKNKLDKKLKILILMIVTVLDIFSFSSRYVFAQNEDKIFINKNDKSILVVLSTTNENRNMKVKTFKEKTKAVNIKSNENNLDENEMLQTGSTAIFKNNEKYTITIYKDENNNGTINSSDIFELLNKNIIDKNSIIEMSNFIIKKEEFENYSITPNRYEEFNENSIVTPSTTPLGPATDRYKEVENINVLKQTEAKVGDKYKTLGYYEKNDGGAGRYDIIEKNTSVKIDNGLYVELNNGLVAKLAVINETVNVKQFGAKGNAKNDDTKYLNVAFNSGISNIELPKGEYKITDIIKLDTPSTNIIGNNSIIFTDNDFKPEKTSEFLFIMQTDNCNINNLSIEARETREIENLYKTQIYVGASNIKIIDCSFKVPETVSNQHLYTNMDLYTGWHNVLIENCNLYLASDAKEGGCIWIRDLFNRSASDLTFVNNTCYKKCHDEILAVFMGSIENVNILNNTFIMPSSTDPSTMCFTFGSNSSKKAENIRFEGNTVDTKATMSLLNSRNATNLSIKNNKIKFERDTTLTNTFFMYFPKDNQSNNPENNSKNVVIQGNNIEIYNNTDKAFNGMISSNASNISFLNNKVTVNSEISEVFTGQFEKISNNNITFNKAIKILVNKPKEFSENHIIFNKCFGTIAQYYNGNLDWNSNILNNTFENNYDEISNDESSIILMFNGGTLNNHIVNFEGNTVKSDKANVRKNLLYLLNLSDTSPQTIKFINNKISGYTMSWRAENQNKHNVVISEYN